MTTSVLWSLFIKSFTVLSVNKISKLTYANQVHFILLVVNLRLTCQINCLYVYVYCISHITAGTDQDHIFFVCFFTSPRNIYHKITDIPFVYTWLRQKDYTPWVSTWTRFQTQDLCIKTKHSPHIPALWASCLRMFLHKIVISESLKYPHAHSTTPSNFVPLV